MQTNIFRMEGFSTLNWTRLVVSPREEQGPRATSEPVVRAVVQANLRLQDAGHLTACGWSSIGHTSDGEPSVWLFYQPTSGATDSFGATGLANLTVAEVGQWRSIDGAEHLTGVLFQALASRAQRALSKAGYVPFGRMLVKCKTMAALPVASAVSSALPAVEFHFAVTSGGVYVHAHCSRRQVRRLVASDMNTAGGKGITGSQEVLVSPGGRIGLLQGGCCAELVKQVQQQQQERGQGCREEPETAVLLASGGPGMETSASGYVEVELLAEPPRLAPSPGQKAHTASQVAPSRLIVPLDEVLVPLWPPPPPDTFLARCHMQGTRLVKDWTTDRLPGVTALSMGWAGTLLSSQNQGHLIPVPGLVQQRADSAAPSVPATSSRSKSHSSTNSSASNSNSSEARDGDSDVESEHSSQRAAAELRAASADAQTTSTPAKRRRSIRGPKLLPASPMTPAGSNPEEVTIEEQAAKRQCSGAQEGSPGSAAESGKEPNAVSLFHQRLSGGHGGAWSPFPLLSPFEDGGLQVDDSAMLAEYENSGEVLEDNASCLGELPDTRESEAVLLPSAGGVAAHSLAEHIRHWRAEARFARWRGACRAEAAAMGAPGYGSSPTIPQHLVPPASPATAATYSPSPGGGPPAAGKGSRLGPRAENGTQGRVYTYGADPPPLKEAPLKGSKETGGEQLKGKGLSGSGSQAALGTDVGLDVGEGQDKGAAGKIAAIRGEWKVPSQQRCETTGQAWPMSGRPVAGTFEARASVEKGVQIGEAGIGASLDKRKNLSKPAVVATALETLVQQMLSQPGPGDGAWVRCRCVFPLGGGLSWDAHEGTGGSPPLHRDLPTPGNLPRRDRMPSRIFGDDDEGAPSRAPQMPPQPVGVWRTLEPPKELPAGKGSLGKTSAGPNTGASSSASGKARFTMRTSPRASSSGRAYWGFNPEALPILLQQLAPTRDLALDFPLSLLGGQQCPMCGGRFSEQGAGEEALAAAEEALHPLTTQMSASAAASLLRMDVGPALAAAFGPESIQGPLSAREWCHGRAFLLAAEPQGLPVPDSSLGSVEREGDPITPPQGEPSPATGSLPAGGSAGGGEASSVDSPPFERESEGAAEEGCLEEAPGLGDGLTPLEDELALAALPPPAILVGYQEDWLVASPSVLQLWEKAPLEPYGPPKPVLYHVLCPQDERLLQGGAHFFNELGTMYEACHLGSHTPITNPDSGSRSTANPPGFVPIPFQPPEGGRDREGTQAYREALRQACQSLLVKPPSSAGQRDADFDPCVVVYVVCPWSQPSAVLDLLLDVATALPAPPGAEKGSLGALPHQPLKSHTTVHLVPANLLLPAGRPLAPWELREVVLLVYAKARRTVLPITATCPPLAELAFPAQVRTLGAAPLSTGPQWKDCSNRTEAAASASASASAAGAGAAGGRVGSPLGCGTGTAEGGAPGDGGSPVERSFSGSGRDGSRVHLLYEPFFTLAEPGRSLLKEGAIRRAAPQEGPWTAASPGPSPASPLGGSGFDSGTEGGLLTGSADPPALHCCYAWVGGDGKGWSGGEAVSPGRGSGTGLGSGLGRKLLVTVWTDARGELLDVHVVPTAEQSGAGVVQESAGSTGGSMQLAFVALIEQGLQLVRLAVPKHGSVTRVPGRQLVISRLGSMPAHECQEWHALLSALSTSSPEGHPGLVSAVPRPGDYPRSGATSEDEGKGQARAAGSHSEGGQQLGLATGSPAPGSPLPAAASGTGLGQTSPWEGVAGVTVAWVQREPSVQLLLDASSSSQSSSQGSNQWRSWSGPSPTAPVPSTPPSSGLGLYPHRWAAATGAAFLLVPNHAPRHMPAGTLAASPAQPLACAMLLPAQPSGQAPAANHNAAGTSGQGYPTVSQNAANSAGLLVCLAAHYVPAVIDLAAQHTAANQPGGAQSPGGTPAEAVPAGPTTVNGRWPGGEVDSRAVVQAVAADLHGLAWLGLSPAQLQPSSGLPMHCSLVQRLRGLLHYYSSSSSSSHAAAL